MSSILLCSVSRNGEMVCFDSQMYEFYFIMLGFTQLAQWFFAMDAMVCFASQMYEFYFIILGFTQWRNGLF
ncbi:hypothetical protein [Halpernia humi]|uniref:hypothetical protein n=1 Tax=Halpernia humi TaxID=493375 RepID=UPI000CDEB4B6|nr:hypothetical protein [Halpernia humi]